MSLVVYVWGVLPILCLDGKTNDREAAKLKGKECVDPFIFSFSYAVMWDAQQVSPVCIMVKVLDHTHVALKAAATSIQTLVWGGFVLLLPLFEAQELGLNLAQHNSSPMP